MKIGNSAENTLVTNAPDANRSKFKIQATGKAFSILSNALYQHKVKAVVREIGCNAFDAHIDANNTAQPFDVTLPCKEDPHFTVRDYGIGLAEDKFVEIYTTYFGSSKADSNDHTGGLGLGSKTPFIMSKSFTVHSYFNGTEYMWHSFVNDNGEPDVMMLHSKPTTEQNGLKVIVPIGQGLSETERTALFRDFKAEAEEIYKWFDIVPNVSVNKVPVIIAQHLKGPKSKYTSLKLTGVDSTTIYYNSEQNKVGQSDRIMVKMGNVVYPYNLKEVRNLDRFGGNIVQTERIIKYITQTGRLNPGTAPLVIDVGMGDVDIAPSREGLSLNNTTELTILNAVVRFTDMFFEAVQTTIDTAKTTYEKYQALYLVPSMGGKNFTIGGKEVDPFKQTPTWIFGSSQELAGKSDRSLRAFDTEDLQVKYRRLGTRGILPMKTSFSMEMYGPAVNQRLIILVDKAYKGELRLWVNANATTDSAVVVVFGEDIKNGNLVSRPLTDAEMAPFLEDGHPQVVKFSQLKNLPVMPVRAANTIVPKATAEDALVLSYTETGYNYFTAGNSRALPIASVLKLNVPTVKDALVYIAYQKSGSTISGEIATAADVTKTEMKDISYWSRAQGRATVWQCGTDFTNEVFHRVASRLMLQGYAVTLNGVKHNIPTTNTATAGIRQIILSKEAYAEIANNPDYPHIYSVDRAIKEIIIPAIPTTVEVHTFKSKDGFVGGLRNSNSVTRSLMHQLDLHKTLAQQDMLADDANSDTTQAISGFKNQSWVKEHNYGSLINSTAVTYTYDYPTRFFSNIIRSAAGDKVPGMKEMVEWLDDCGSNGNFEPHLTTGYYCNKQETIDMIFRMLKRMLKNAGYSATEFDNYVLDYTDTHRVIS